MLKPTSIPASFLSALVIAGATVAFDPLPAAAQTASRLDCIGCVKSKHVKDGGVTSKDIKNSGIKSKDIKDGQVKNADMGTDAVTGDKIAPGAVGNDDLGTDAVTGDKIAPGTVGDDDLGADAVTNEKVADGAVTLNKLGSDVVSEIETLDDRVTALEKAAPPPLLVVRDADGFQVGDTIRTTCCASAVRVGILGLFGERTVSFFVESQGISPGGGLVFLQAGCAGDAYFGARLGFPPAIEPSSVVLRADDRQLWVATDDKPETLMTKSQLDSGFDDCFDLETELVVLPADLHVPNLHAEFRPPFTLNEE